VLCRLAVYEPMPVHDIGVARTDRSARVIDWG
jgi:hypothetical protein